MKLARASIVSIAPCRIAPLGRWRPARPARAIGGRAIGLPAAGAPGAAAVKVRVPWAFESASMKVRRFLAGPGREAGGGRQAPAFHFSPTIRLSIAPLLRQTFWHTAAGMALPERAVATDATPPRPAARRPVPRRGAQPPSSAPKPPPDAERVSRQPLQVVAALPAPGPAPVQRVLRRLRGEDRSAAGDAGGDPGDDREGRQGRQGSYGSLARGLMEHLRRQEGLPDEPPATGHPATPRRRPGSFPTASAAPWDEPAYTSPLPPTMHYAARHALPLPPALHAPNVPAPQMLSAAPPAPSLPSVEALTDRVMQQIDRRLGAWRERTGTF
jgi:hypothetical protein